MLITMKHDEGRRPTCPALETSRLSLEPLLPSHAALLFADLQDTRIYTHIPDDPPPSVDSLKARFEILANRRSPNGEEIWLNWAIRQRRDGTYVGMTQATLERRPVARIAYLIFPRYWRNHFAHEAIGEMVAFLCRSYALNQIEAQIDTRNISSIRTVESLEFVRTGLHLNRAWFKGAASHEFTYTMAPCQSAIAMVKATS